MVRWIPGVVVVLVACQPTATDPIGCYRSFHQAISNGDWPQAVAWLTPDTRRAFEQMSRRLAEADDCRQDCELYFPRMMRVDPGRRPMRVKLIERDASRARIEVMSGPCDAAGDHKASGDRESAETCAKNEVRLRRIGGRWLIEPDLPEALLASVAGSSGG